MKKIHTVKVDMNWKLFINCELKKYLKIALKNFSDNL